MTWEFLIRENGRAAVVAVEAKTPSKAWKALKAARPDYGEAQIVTMVDERQRLCLQRPLWLATERYKPTATGGDRG